MDTLDLANFSSWSGCVVQSLSLRYLGVPLGASPRCLSFWDPIIEKVSKRLDSWKIAYFSLGGRITLIQSCLTSIPLYYLSLSKVLLGVARRLERFMRDFLWSGSGEDKRTTLWGGIWFVGLRRRGAWGLGI